MTIAVTMVKLLFAMALGFYFNKKDILTPDVNKKLSAMIVNFTCPILIISSASSAADGDPSAVYILLVGGVIFYLITLFWSPVIVRMLGVDKDLRGIYRCMLIFSNSAFMGYPVCEALFGSTAVFYASVFNFMFNILFFSYATYIIAKDAGQTSGIHIKQLINMGTISAVIALVVYFAGIKLPDLILSPLSFVGGLTTPMSMLIIGANMATYKLGDIFKNKKMYVLTVIRLLILPILTALVFQCFTKSYDVLGVAVMTAAMPVASLVAMGSSQYEKQGKIASVSVVFTTICSMVTIPIIAILLNVFFGN